MALGFKYAAFLCLWKSKLGSISLFKLQLHPIPPKPNSLLLSGAAVELSKAIGGL